MEWKNVKTESTSSRLLPSSFRSCICCQKPITSKTVLNYDSYSDSLARVYPNITRDCKTNGGGCVCLSCVNKAKSQSARELNLTCACCGGELAGHTYSYTNKRYHNMYKTLFPQSPLNNSPKVCQNCYVKAKQKEPSASSTSESTCTPSPCPVCSISRKLIYSFFKYQDQYKEINPNAPINTSPNVCDICYRKALSIELKAMSCACCGNTVGGTVLKYSSNSIKYKAIFPDSPLSNSNRVCIRCYRKMKNEMSEVKIEKAEHQQESKKKRKRSPSVSDQPEQCMVFPDEVLVEVYSSYCKQGEMYNHEGTLHVHIPGKLYRGEEIENLFAAKVSELINSIDIEILLIEKLENSGPNSTIINNELYSISRSTVFLVYIRNMAE